MPQGLFITFEGTEGAGKSTQIKRLADRLQAEGHRVSCLREPGGTPIGEEIRHTLQHSHDNRAMAPETELLLMNASRAQLVREIIRPALKAGHVVLCDRFYDSTIAYQGSGRGLSLEAINRIIEFTVGTTIPDLTILLRIPLNVSEDRRIGRHSKGPSPQRDRFEEEDRAFFERVARGFEEQSRKEPNRFRTVDGDRDMTAVEEEIWAAVYPLLRAQGH